MKKLDKKDKTYINYSTQDGKNIKNIFTDKITLKQKSICYNCKAENNKKSYCKYCGKSLDEVEHLEKVQNIKAFNVDTKPRSEEHTSELQSRFDLVCRLLLEKKNKHDK